ncbi:TRAP transporter substrate-binding protein DctP [Paracoccus sediminilitoris]|uniref:TRAP transporter substrate-binding protein DctP n=1 Tax=Paracoccus sediminilitoris TaxID=2202419 RepID=UPI000DBA0281|nr:TRAP transporter substrate-binding protein DctP [Paracoccus sediminilitoris]
MTIKATSAALAAAIALIAGTASAETFRIATNAPETAGPGQLLQAFADAVAERTDGRVSFEIFANSVLGDQTEYFQQLQSGVVDLGLVNSATLENILPAIGVVNLPYMFRTKEEYGQVMSDPELRELLFEGAEQQNFLPLGFLSNGFRSLYTTQPVTSIEDLQGMKIRTMSSDTYIEMLTLFGAAPTPMAFGDVYPALQQGVIDGAEGTLSTLYDLNFGQAAKYGIKTEQTRLTDFVVTSVDFRNAISPEDYEIVREEFANISEKSLEVIDEAFQASAQRAVDEFGVTITDIDKTPFIEAVQPMYAEAAENETKRAVIEKIFTMTGRELQ